MADKIDLPLVKIAWIVHTREYEVGIIPFLKELGVDVTQQEILTVVNKFLSKQ